MNQVNILEAWSLWLAGQLQPNTMLWGVSILWWGRIGKLLQFVGAITIIADIIGPEKIRRFGASFQSTITSIILIQFLRDCFRWYVIVFRQTLMKDYADEVIPKEQLRLSKLDLFNFLICFLLTVIVIFSIKLQSTGWSLLIEATIIFFCLLVSISPIVTVLTVISLILTGLVINSIFVKPLAWTLENPSLDRYTKIISLILLLLGFHFDLLAS